jgi:ankyrin repeat protein
LAADFKEKAGNTAVERAQKLVAKWDWHDANYLRILDELEAEISEEFDKLSTDLATPEKMSWLNQDSNYKQSICEVIDFKNIRLSKLIRSWEYMSALDVGYLKDPLTTDLHVAAREGQPKTIAALLSFGADTDAIDNAGRTALELAKDDVTFEALKAGGATMSDMTHEKKNSLLLEYAGKGLRGGVFMALQAGADANHKNPYGKGALDHTKEIKDEETRAAVLALMAEYSVLCAVATKAGLVAAAVAKGCNMNETDQEGNSCLHIAAAQGSNDILRILLNAGAKITAKNKAGNTAVELAQNAQTIEVLKAAGATMPEIPDEKKNTLLLEYAGKGLTGGVLMALQAGADANHKDRDSDTALHHAACNGHHVLAQALLGAGADVNAKNSWSKTALHYAAEYGRHALAQALLGAGSDVNAKDSYFETPLNYAIDNGKREVEALHRQHGAE